jgi:hypothetical protein
MMVGDRQRHCHLAIGLLAELSAILMLHSNRMLALLRKCRIVDDPDFDRGMPCHRRHHKLAHFGKHLFIRPWRVGDEVQELLMLRRNVPRIRHRRHWLYAAAALRRQQPGAIIPQRLLPVRMPDRLRQGTNVRIKTSRNLLPGLEIHSSLPLTGISTTI